MLPRSELIDDEDCLAVLYGWCGWCGLLIFICKIYVQSWDHLVRWQLGLRLKRYSKLRLLEIGHACPSQIAWQTSANLLNPSLLNQLDQQNSHHSLAQSDCRNFNSKVTFTYVVLVTMCVFSGVIFLRACTGLTRWDSWYGDLLSDTLANMTAALCIAIMASSSIVSSGPVQALPQQNRYGMVLMLTCFRGLSLISATTVNNSHQQSCSIRSCLTVFRVNLLIRRLQRTTSLCGDDNLDTLSFN